MFGTIIILITAGIIVIFGLMLYSAKVIGGFGLLLLFGISLFVVALKPIADILEQYRLREWMSSVTENKDPFWSNLSLNQEFDKTMATDRKTPFLTKNIGLCWLTLKRQIREYAGIDLQNYVPYNHVILKGKGVYIAEVNPLGSYDEVHRKIHVYAVMDSEGRWCGMFNDIANFQEYLLKFEPSFDELEMHRKPQPQEMVMNPMMPMMQPGIMPVAVQQTQPQNGEKKEEKK